MNLLITGGYGFIASNFINQYFQRHPEINLINIDAMYYCARKENVLTEIRGSARYTEVIGNLASFDLVSHIINAHNITHVIHFAAQSHVDNSFENALQYTQDNICGTHVLLEVC